MSQNSRSSKGNEAAAFDALKCLLNDAAVSGKDIVERTRKIVRAYSLCGFSIDDPELESLIGIESETDTMDLESECNDDDLNHVFEIYNEPFEQSRQNLRRKLGGLVSTK
jgi:hypothetical protein